MIEREIIKVDRDINGRITALRNQYKGWSPISIEEAVKQIEYNICKYYINATNIGKVEIHVISDKNGKFLRTDPSRTSRNILMDLAN